MRPGTRSTWEDESRRTSSVRTPISCCLAAPTTTIPGLSRPADSDFPGHHRQPPVPGACHRWGNRRDGRTCTGDASGKCRWTPAWLQPAKARGTGGRLAMYPAKKMPAARMMPTSTLAGVRMTLLFRDLGRKRGRDGSLPHSTRLRSVSRGRDCSLPRRDYLRFYSVTACESGTAARSSRRTSRRRCCSRGSGSSRPCCVVTV